MASSLDESVEIEASTRALGHLAQVQQVPAAISWTDANGSPQMLLHDPVCHDHVTLDIFFDEELNMATMRIAANIAFKGKRNKSNIFLFVYPEQIHTLTIVEDKELASRLGTNAHNLQIVLSVPPALVVPATQWTPKNQDAQSVLSALHSLAAQITFRIAFPSISVPRNVLASFCQQASTRGCLRTMAAASNIAKFYGGQGGRVVDLGDSPGPSKPQDSQSGKGIMACQNLIQHSPPSYDNLDSPLALAPAAKKRRLHLATNDGIEKEMSLEDICKQGFMDMGRRFDCIEKTLSDLTSRLDRVEQLVKASSGTETEARQQHSDEANTLEERIKVFEERVTDVETRLDTGFKDVSVEIENALYDVRHEFNDTITVRMEEEMGAAQGELEDFVKDEVRNVARDVEETVKEQLRSALE